MALSKKGKIAIGVVCWFSLIGVAAVSYKYFFAPRQQEIQKQTEINKRNKVIAETGATPLLNKTITLNLDSFSGYAVYRSLEFKNECAKRGIRLDVVDDGANYEDRLNALKNGNCQMAVFTIDALVKVCANNDNLSGTIVWVSDESHGADAMVGNASVFSNIDSINHPDTKFVVVPDSPSETLALVVRDHFNLDKLGSDAFIHMKDAKEVFDAYKASKPTDRKVFVLWEPYVSKVLENKDYKIIVDSSKFRDYIVDVMVVSRDFLIKNKKDVKAVAEAYFSALYAVKENMNMTIAKDARSLKTPLTDEQSNRLTQTIEFKNTQENYAHFGIRQGYNLQHIENIIAEITNLELRSGIIDHDPTNNQLNVLYYPDILSSMFDDNFRPGNTFQDEDIRQDSQLPALTDSEWDNLQPVGSLQVSRLVFRRGSPVLSAGSEKTLSDLVEKLNKWPNYYLIIRGSSSNEGDAEANRILADLRSQATKDWLTEHGVNSNRIKAENVKPNGTSTVSFVLAEKEY